MQKKKKKSEISVVYMCGAAFDFHCLEILVGNEWEFMNI